MVTKTIGALVPTYCTRTPFPSTFTYKALAYYSTRKHILDLSDPIFIEAKLCSVYSQDQYWLQMKKRHQDKEKSVDVVLLAYKIIRFPGQVLAVAKGQIMPRHTVSPDLSLSLFFDMSTCELTISPSLNCFSWTPA